MIEICNLRNQKMEFDYDVKVDRSSVLGNIFYMHNEEERDYVCEQYEQYFYNKMFGEKYTAFTEEVERLISIYNKYGKLRLFCWCAPKRCHAETIKEYIESNNRTYKNWEIKNKIVSFAEFMEDGDLNLLIKELTEMKRERKEIKNAIEAEERAIELEKEAIDGKKDYYEYKPYYLYR